MEERLQITKTMAISGIQIFFKGQQEVPTLMIWSGTAYMTPDMEEAYAE